MDGLGEMRWWSDEALRVYASSLAVVGRGSRGGGGLAQPAGTHRVYRHRHPHHLYYNKQIHYRHREITGSDCTICLTDKREILYTSGGGARHLGVFQSHDPTPFILHILWRSRFPSFSTFF